MKAKRFTIPFFVAIALLQCVASAEAATIWDADDGTISFSKAAFADPTDPANQDAITPNVAITRGAVEGIYNAATETGYNRFTSPADTAWAFSGSNGNPTFAFGEGAENYTTLTFADWAPATDMSPPSSVGRPGVVHLISDDIYIDIMFTAWGAGGGAGGGFSYIRAVPEPTTGVLAGVAMLAAVCWHRRK